MPRTGEIEVICLLQITGAGPKFSAFIIGDEEGRLRSLGLFDDAPA
jgi:hypothetical protein